MPSQVKSAIRKPYNNFSGAFLQIFCYFEAKVYKVFRLNKKFGSKTAS